MEARDTRCSDSAASAPCSWQEVGPCSFAKAMDWLTSPWNSSASRYGAETSNRIDSRQGRSSKYGTAKSACADAGHVCHASYLAPFYRSVKTPNWALMIHVGVIVAMAHPARPGPAASSNLPFPDLRVSRANISKQKRPYHEVETRSLLFRNYLKSLGYLLLKKEDGGPISVPPPNPSIPPYPPPSP